MAISDKVGFTWIGHGTWRARSAAGMELLRDPWVMNNPVAPEHLKTIDRCDLMLVTHGHFDHIYDALEIGKKTSPKLVAIPETATWLGSKGFPGAGQNAHLSTPDRSPQSASGAGRSRSAGAGHPARRASLEQPNTGRPRAAGSL